ncbi:ribosome recycling factor [Planococcus sp. CP5-4]|uniref:ribosome recycling factor n=1 Tax=unclassified Planococcus (in: firmicutes) TaxID=2662419 RepID=UPI001C23887D|nr:MULTISPECIES: ribosome recycling factor [unclassified Planococcus (in: firmicutes)]MBU9672073.1 ribosome recycling factor [Planococcus sp. CP5-4_YE]MBV0907636.1 ribosome recycling factor [Planococcus sp. CP5-4_UN]MBW6062803.1 ribosome recycling factor [Planococcus sp. CP5-4]
MPKTIMNDTKTKMSNAIQTFSRDLASIRAGRATPSLLDKITVEYYGAPTPINQVAGVSVPEARLIMIQPYDKTVLPEIEKAIMKSDLGLSPSNDGNVIRLAVPALTEERRKDLVKQVKKEAEEAKVVIRNIRRDANDDLKKLEKKSEITADDLRGYSDDVQDMTNTHIAKIDDMAKDKETEIMAV